MQLLACFQINANDAISPPTTSLPVTPSPSNSLFFLNSWKGNPVLRVDSDLLQVSGNAVVGNAAFTMPATFRWSLLTVRRF